MTAIKLKEEIQATMRKHGFQTAKIAVELDGKICYLTSTEVRALQLMVKQNNELRERIKIYSGRTKRGSHIIDISSDGYLDEPINGFMDIDGNLMRELL